MNNDAHSLYVLVISTVGTILSLAGVWITNLPVA